MPVADIDGSQRKALWVRARPLRNLWGEEGIPIREGKTLPFFLSRGWNAPAGHYPEAWYLVDPATREVLHESATVERHVWGLPAVTEYTDKVVTPIDLTPGSYLIVLVLGGMSGGEFAIQAFDVPEEAAA